MYQLIKKIFYPGKKVDGSSLVYHPADNFSTLLNKMNQYFDLHVDERKNYKAEFDFINSINLNIPVHEKKLYSIIPYDFITRYDYKNVEVFWDEKSAMFYVYLEGKKLYYHEGFKNVEDVQKSFTYISVEQNLASPHRYLNDFFFVNEEDVVVDLGAAEGNFSLSVVEKAKQLIIVESDEVWLNALHKTFEPWKEKVKIINKFVGDKNLANTITLEEIQQENSVTAIKMDIEGAEVSVLRSSKIFLLKNRPKLAITTYHRHTDANIIKTILEQSGYTTEFTDGYLLFVYDNLEPPYFRKGLIRAKYSE